MKVLKTFPIPEEFKTSKKKIVREACRMVAFDSDNFIPLLFVSTENYHKLPGWWIDAGENKEEALTRELLEETWCEIEITGEI